MKSHNKASCISRPYSKGWVDIVTYLFDSRDIEEKKLSKVISKEELVKIYECCLPAYDRSTEQPPAR
jgi:hypothetical protein